MDTTPFLSVVVAARNDNHGGNLLHRMQLFVTGLLEQARRFGLAGELILVEWNPPPAKPGLAQALDFCGANTRFSVRIIQVPHAIHARLAYADRLPFFQMIAKNVGIRRARGKFILATNVDVLLPDELMARFTEPGLRAGMFYRVNRYDVPADVPTAPIEKQLAYCRKKSNRIYLRNGVFSIASADAVSPALVWMGSSRNVLATMARWLWRSWQGVLPVNQPTGETGVRQDFAVLLASRLNTSGLPALHYNACGDFTLLAQSDWCTLRGYPELAMYSLHLDSLFCLNAYYANLREQVWDAPVGLFHIDHAQGWTNNAQSNQALLNLVDRASVPVLSIDQLRGYAKQMRERRRPLDFNGADWGLASESLTEIAFQ